MALWCLFAWRTEAIENAMAVTAPSSVVQEIPRGPSRYAHPSIDPRDAIRFEMDLERIHDAVVSHAMAAFE